MGRGVDQLPYCDIHLQDAQAKATVKGRRTQEGRGTGTHENVLGMDTSSTTSMST